MDLKNRFFELFAASSNDLEMANTYWAEIEKAHGHKKRVYHNLTHLENLFIELESVKDQIEDWHTVSWSVFYHDIVYNVRKQDNEEQSAILAVTRLKEVGYPIDKIKRCEAQIIATKSHETTADNDANLFTDADLSILGKEWTPYKTYFEAIRKEYKIYPNLLYKPARKKVLQHFLEMAHLFKTKHFQEKYDEQARRNILKELESY